jgi:two-component system chemotaxis response regulator CheY
MNDRYFYRGDNHMKTLIVEDDFTSRLLMQELLKEYGLPHVAINGHEAVEAVRAALEAGQPYDLICLDIMMPGMDGLQALREIRALEDAKGIFSSEGAKILMTTALTDMQKKIDAFAGLCDGYLSKPIHKARLLEELRKFNLIPS